MATKRIHPLLLLVILGLLFVVGFVLWLVVNQPRLPVDPVLEKISLTLPKDTRPDSSALEKVLLSAPKGIRQEIDALHKQYRRGGAMLKFPIQDGQSLLSKHHTWLTSFTREFSASVCYPKPKTLDMTVPTPPHGSGLLQGIKLLGIQALSLAHQNKPEDGVRSLLQALHQLEQYATHCPRTLLDNMIWMAARRVVIEDLSYLFVHPGLSVSSQQNILARLADDANATKVPVNPVVHAYRFEAMAHLHMYKNITKFAPIHEQRLLRWPWWDPEQNIQWTRRLFQSHIHQASQPTVATMWNQTASDRFFLTLTVQDAWTNVFRYNSVGQVLFSVARPAFHKFTAKWHQHRCFAAAKHNQLLHVLRTMKSSQDRVLPPVLPNPLTQQPFGVVGKLVCAVQDNKGKEILPALPLLIPPKF